MTAAAAAAAAAAAEAEPYSDYMARVIAEEAARTTVELVNSADSWVDLGGAPSEPASTASVAPLRRCVAMLSVLSRLQAPEARVLRAGPAKVAAGRAWETGWEAGGYATTVRGVTGGRSSTVIHRYM